MVELRQNRVKHVLDEGGVATIVGGPHTAEMIEFLGSYGFDGVWIEGEHGPVDFADIPNLTRACDLWGMTPVVRVNLNLPGVIYRTLDVGAQAVVIPHVNTADEARVVADASKFYPIGHRGNYTSRQGVGVADYAKKANAETLAVILIEDIVAIDNLGEILQVEGIDVFFVAPGDLAQSMGRLGEPGHPEVQAVVDRAFEQIVGAGKVAGALTTDANVDHNIAMGVQLPQHAVGRRGRRPAAGRSWTASPRPRPSPPEALDGRPKPSQHPLRIHRPAAGRHDGLRRQPVRPHAGHGQHRRQWGALRAGILRQPRLPAVAVQHDDRPHARRGRHPQQPGRQRGQRAGRGHRSTSMGWLLREAGYDAAYGGKVHMPPGMSPRGDGASPT